MMSNSKFANSHKIQYDKFVFFSHTNKGNYFKLNVNKSKIERIDEREFQHNDWPVIEYNRCLFRCKGSSREGYISVLKKFFSQYPMLVAQSFDEFATGLKTIYHLVQAIGKGKKILDSTMVDIMMTLNGLISSILTVFSHPTCNAVLSFVSHCYNTVCGVIKKVYGTLTSQSYEAMALSILSGYIPDSLMSIIKRMNIFTNQKLCDDTGLFQDLIELVTGLINWIVQQFGVILPQPVLAKINDLINWTSKRTLVAATRELLQKYNKQPSVIGNPFFVQEVKEIVGKWNTIPSLHEWITRSNYIRSMWEGISNCNKCIIAQENVVRQEPLMYVFEGPPGVLKSTLLTAVLKCCTGKQVYAHTIKTINDGKDFYDTYNNEEIFVMDDVGQQGVSQWRTFINLVSCTNYKLDCADKEKKDTKFFTSSHIFVTTNRFQNIGGLCKNDGIDNIEALWRRGFVIDFSDVENRGGRLYGILKFKYYSLGESKFVNSFPEDMNSYLKDFDIELSPSMTIFDDTPRHEIIAWILAIDRVLSALRKSNYQSARVDDAERQMVEAAVRNWTHLAPQGMCDDDYVAESEPVSWTKSLREIVASIATWILAKEDIVSLAWWVGVFLYILSTCYSIYNTSKKTPITSAQLRMGWLGPYVDIKYASILKSQYNEQITPIVDRKPPTNVEFLIKNMYQVSMKVAGKTIDATACVSGHYVILPSHYTKEHDGYISLMEKDTGFLRLDSQPFKVVYRNEAEDVMILALDKSIPSYFKSISKHVYTDKHEIKIMKPWLITPVGAVDLHTTLGYKEEPFVYNHLGDLNIIKRGLRYAHGFTGMCGCLVYDPQAGICGMHLAGDPGGAAAIWGADVRKEVKRILDEDLLLAEPDIVRRCEIENGIKIDCDAFNYVNQRSSLQPSPLFGVFPVDRFPANLKKYKGKTVQVVGSKSLLKTATLQKDELEFVRKVFASMIDPYSEISYYEVVKGNELLAGLNPDSSNGYGCDKRKDTYVDFENGCLTSRMMQEIAELESDITAGLYDVNKWMWEECLKDEIRNVEKDGEPRSFRISRIHTQIMAKKLTGEFVSNTIKNKWTSGIMVGINPYRDWSRLYDELVRCDGVFDGDIAKWDGGMLPQLQYVLAEEVERKFSGDKERKDLLRFLLMQAINTPVIMGDDVVVTTHSMPSGSFWTAIFNSYINRGYTALWYYRECRKSNITPNLYQFFDVIKDYTYGDDKLVGVKKTNLNLTARSMSDFFYSIGLGFTDACKKPITYDFSSLSEVSFLKRNFKYHTKIGRIMCPLSLRTLLNSLSWFDEKKDVRVVMVDKLHSFQRELYLHDDKILAEELLNILEKRCHKENIPFSLLSSTYLLNLYLDDSAILSMPWHSSLKNNYF